MRMSLIKFIVFQGKQTWNRQSQVCKKSVRAVLNMVWVGYQISSTEKAGFAEGMRSKTVLKNM